MNTPFRMTPLCSQLLLTGVLSVALPVAAQSADPAAEAPKSAGQAKLQEVVVTATKVATPASKTPIALSVLGGDDLKAAGVVDARALSEVSPSLQISQNTGALQINIRGVQSLDTTEKGDPSNAFHVDGMYIGRPQAQFGALLDVQRVEVLRGPQGTLYGRNATGGAVNVITNKPGKKLGGTLSVELGNFHTRRAEGAVDIPVNEVLSLRAAASANKRDSYLKSDTGIGLEDQDEMAGRLHGLLTFSPRTSLLVTLESSRVNSNGFTPLPLSNFYTGTPVHGSAAYPNDFVDPVSLNPDGKDALTFPTGVPYLRDTQRHLENNGLRTEFKHEMNGADLTYQLGYLKSRGAWDFLGMFNGGSFYGQEAAFLAEQTSHELRLNSNRPGPFSWVVGAYVFDETIDRDTQFNTTFGNGFVFRLKYLPHVTNRSRAVFGQTGYALSDKLKLVTGLRYTRDYKAVQDPFGGGGLTIPVTPIDRSNSYTKITGKVGLDYDLDKNTFAYVSLSTGYKAGGFNGDAQVPPYEPESLTSLEGGVKTKALDGRLQISASAFAYDYRDLQLTSTVCADPANPSNCNSRTVNAAKAKVHGLEVEGKLVASAAGVVDFGASLLRSRFGRYLPLDHPGNAPTVVVDWSGQRLDSSPAVTMRVGYRHTFTLASDALIEVGASARHSGSYLLSAYGADYATRYEQKAMTKFDANVTWRSPDDRYAVQGYIRNITDKVGVAAVMPGAATTTDPRTYGVRLTSNF
ncbi:TonB-dependent receptor [Pseudaquabacterium rugosum]|uniref:TonB-dependent receptor n=1 Tax=Pseudaquabacterium rugosum TaxID=2984194 RepID=A0ABU9BAH8_9BURK